MVEVEAKKWLRGLGDNSGVIVKKCIMALEVVWKSSGLAVVSQIITYLLEFVLFSLEFQFNGHFVISFAHSDSFLLTLPLRGSQVDVTSLCVALIAGLLHSGWSPVQLWGGHTVASYGDKLDGESKGHNL